jgi:predicted PurR-regulated permease PerM
MLDVLGARLRWWMIGTMGGMTIVFSASSIGYSISRLKFAFPLALLAGLCEIVPTVGPATAAVIALLFAASQSASAVVGVIITYAVIQSLEAYIILPLIMRGAVKIHPAISLFSVVFWAKILGLPGLMMAIPINLVLGSAVEYMYVRPRERNEAEADLAAISDAP